jgi:hypothetical protein
VTVALAPIAALLAAAGCSAATEAPRQQEPAALALARQIGADCAARGGSAAGQEQAEARRTALAGAVTPARLAAVTSIAGEQPARVVDRAGVLGAAAERDLAERSRCSRRRRPIRW